MNTATQKPMMIGSINCYLASACIVNGQRLQFNGTTKDLVITAHRHGACVGDTVKADFGGGFQRYAIVAAPYDNRACGLWAIRA